MGPNRRTLFATTIADESADKMGPNRRTLFATTMADDEIEASPSKEIRSNRSNQNNTKPQWAPSSADKMGPNRRTLFATTIAEKQLLRTTVARVSSRAMTIHARRMD